MRVLWLCLVTVAVAVCVVWIVTTQEGPTSKDKTGEVLHQGTFAWLQRLPVS